jgi:hypothetical protein
MAGDDRHWGDDKMAWDDMLLPCHGRDGHHRTVPGAIPGFPSWPARRRRQRRHLWRLGRWL